MKRIIEKDIYNEMLKKAKPGMVEVTATAIEYNGKTYKSLNTLFNKKSFKEVQDITSDVFSKFAIKENVHIDSVYFKTYRESGYLALQRIETQAEVEKRIELKAHFEAHRLREKRKEKKRKEKEAEETAAMNKRIKIGMKNVNYIKHLETENANLKRKLKIS